MTLGGCIAVVVAALGVLYGLSWRTKDEAVSNEWVKEQIRERGVRGQS